MLSFECTRTVEWQTKFARTLAHALRTSSSLV